MWYLHLTYFKRSFIVEIFFPFIICVTIYAHDMKQIQRASTGYTQKNAVIYSKNIYFPRTVKHVPSSDYNM